MNRERTYTLRGLFVRAALSLVLLPVFVLAAGLVIVGLANWSTIELAPAIAEAKEERLVSYLSAHWDQIGLDPAGLDSFLAGEGVRAEVRDLQERVVYASAGIVDGHFRRQGLSVVPEQRTRLIRTGSGTVGYFTYWVVFDRTQSQLDLAVTLGLWAGLLTLVGLLLWNLRAIGRRILGPLRSLAQATEAVAAGDLSFTTPTTTVRELAALSRGFGEMRDRLRRSLERQQRLEDERRQFIAAIGHDLRTPLSSVRAFAEGLRDGLARDPEKTARYSQVILEKTQAVERLVEGLFEFAKLDLPGQKAAVESVSAPAYLSRAVQALQPVADERGIHLRADGPEIPLRVDPSLFMRVIDNLLTNALRHTPSGGVVRVTWNPVDGGQGGPAGVRITVEDTGEGIPEDELPHLFSPLHRTDRSRSRRSGGTGLGLAITARIVAAHGGQIRCESEVGRGTRFLIDLPE